MEYDKDLRQEEIVWYQSRKNDWINLGDKNNNKYFRTHIDWSSEEQNHWPSNWWQLGNGWWYLRQHAFSLFFNRFAGSRLSTTLDEQLIHISPTAGSQICEGVVSFEEVTTAMHGMKPLVAPVQMIFMLLFTKHFERWRDLRFGSFSAVLLLRGNSTRRCRKL